MGVAARRASTNATDENDTSKNDVENNNDENGDDEQPDADKSDVKQTQSTETPATEVDNSLKETTITSEKTTTTKGKITEGIGAKEKKEDINGGTHTASSTPTLARENTDTAATAPIAAPLPPPPPPPRALTPEEEERAARRAARLEKAREQLARDSQLPADFVPRPRPPARTADEALVAVQLSLLLDQYRLRDTLVWNLAGMCVCVNVLFMKLQCVRGCLHTHTHTRTYV